MSSGVSDRYPASFTSACECLHKKKTRLNLLLVTEGWNTRCDFSKSEQILNHWHHTLDDIVIV